MRTSLAVMAALLSGLMGLRIASALREDASRLRRWAEVLTHLALILGEETVSLPDALRLAGDGHGAPDMLLHETAASLAASPLTPLPDAFARLCPDGPERETLLRLFPRLAWGSAEARALAARQTAEAICRMAEAAEARAVRDAKLFQTLGWTGGGCLALLLL